MHKKIGAAVVVMAVVVFGLVWFAATSYAAALWSVNAEGSASAQVGQSNSYSAIVADDGGSAVSGAIVDFEVHDASGAKVFQQFFSNQNFSAGQSKSYSVAWAPTAAGQYTLEVGIFSTNWSSMLYWEGNALGITASNPAPQFSSTVNVPAVATVGQPITIGSNIKDIVGSASGAIVDFEVHDASGAKVFQQFFSNQNFSAGQSPSYTASWTPSATSTAGTYSVDIGVFMGNWSQALYWNDGTTLVLTAPKVMSTVNGTIISKNNLSGFYVDPDSSAATQAIAWQTSDPADAARMSVITEQPQAVWFGGWNTDVTSDVNTLVGAAQSAGKMPLLVAYNIPDRDCGGYSAGGAETAAAYQSWIQAFAAGIGSRPATVILEPDALAGMDCLSAADQTTRLSLLTYAVQTLKSLGQTKVYIDAGNSNWISASEMATRLEGADIAAADGFSLNVSNFYTTAANTAYGTAVSALVGGKHFVIDTSRNGAGSDDGAWCNPPGMALGILPTTATGNSLIDALLWIKPPGESDGTCNGGPAAGTWWPQYAATLAENAGY